MFTLTNLALFACLPFAYLLCESEGFIGQYSNYIRFALGFPLVLLRFSSGSPQVSSGYYLVVFRFSSGSPQVLFRFSSGSLQVLLRFSGSPQVLIRLSGSHQFLLWFFSGYPLVFLSSPQILLNFSSGSPLVIPLFFLSFPHSLSQVLLNIIRFEPMLL